MSVVMPENHLEVVHFAARCGVWYGESGTEDDLNPTWAPCSVLLIEPFPQQYYLIVLTDKYRNCDSRRVSSLITANWHLSLQQRNGEVSWSQSAMLGVTATAGDIRMYLRFGKAVPFWDFVRQFSDAVYLACKRAGDISLNLDRICRTENFAQYTRLYLAGQGDYEEDDSEEESSDATVEGQGSGDDEGSE